MSMFPGGMTALKETEARSRVVPSPLCFWWGGRSWHLSGDLLVGIPRAAASAEAPWDARAGRCEGQRGGQRGWSLDSKDEGDRR